jgi:tRNA(Ile)-lysidine synthase TilS/MesJ
MNSNGLLEKSLLASKPNSAVYSVSGGQDSILSVIILLHFFSSSIFQRNFDNLGCDTLPKFINYWNRFVGYKNSPFLVKDHISHLGPPNCAQFGGKESEKGNATKKKGRKIGPNNNEISIEIVYCQHFWQSKNFFCSELLFELSWLGELSYTLILSQTSVQSENKARVWRKKNLTRFLQLQKIFSVGLGHTKTDFIEKSINNLLRGTSPKSFSKSVDLNFKYSTNLFFTSLLFKPQIGFLNETLLARNLAQDFLFCTHAPKNSQFLGSLIFFKHSWSTLDFFETKNQQPARTISKNFTELVPYPPNCAQFGGNKSKKEKQGNNIRKTFRKLRPSLTELVSKNETFELQRKKTFEKKMKWYVYRFFSNKPLGAFCSKRKKAPSSENFLKTRKLIKHFYSKTNKLKSYISLNCCCFSLKITKKLILLRFAKTEKCRTRDFISFLGSRKKNSNNFVVVEVFSLSFCLTRKILQKPQTWQTSTNSLTRLQVSKIVKFYDLPVMHDMTNFSTDFSRNKIRHVFLPFTRLIFATQFENVYSSFIYLVSREHEQIQIKLFEFKKIFKFFRVNPRIGLLISQECEFSEFLKQSLIQISISEYKEIEISSRDLKRVVKFLVHI